MSYRITWAGPWNAHSAIAQFGQGIVQALTAQGHTVQIFRTETGESAQLAPLPADGPVVAPGVTGALEAFAPESIVVNLGDNFGFHGGVFGLLEQKCCVGVFHDASMGGFEGTWRAMDPAGWDAFLARALPTQPDGTSLVRRLATLMTGAVVHARHYRDEIAEACPGPVAILPLAMSFTELCRDLPPPPRGVPFLLGTIGHVNANKRVDQVIHAIAASPLLRARVRYIVAGPIEPHVRAELDGLARRLRVEPPVFMGRVSDQDLHILLGCFDAICCLRDPVFEGGSASLILALRSGRPTLVSDHGSYAELPDDVVLKCSPGWESAHVAFHLEGLLADPDSAARLSARARAYAENAFDPVRYAEGLIAALEAAAQAGPRVLAERQVARTLRSLGLPADRRTLQRATRGLSDLLADREQTVRQGV